MKKILLLFASFTLIAVAACRLALPGSDGDDRSSGTDPRYPGVSPASLGPHLSQFKLNFEGDESWSYRLETARTNSTLGHDLDIDGVALSDSPGDVRLIVEDGQVRMAGEATQDACWLFPEKSELQRSFLTPDSVFRAEELELTLEDADVRTAGRRAARYSVSEGFSERWRQVEGTLWLDGRTGAVLMFEFSAEGQDPFFDFGSGRIEGDYRILEVGDQTIEPIGGCELPYPVTDDARNLVLLEDYMAYETDSAREEMIEFYARWFEDEGWRLIEGPEAGPVGTVMTLQQGDRLKEVTAREVEGGTQVEIFSEAAG